MMPPFVQASENIRPSETGLILANAFRLLHFLDDGPLRNFQPEVKHQIYTSVLEEYSQEYGMCILSQ
jgi:hypothetical protein